MLIRLSLIIAIIAGLAVGALNFVKVKEIITTTRKERDDERTAKEEAQRNLAKTRSDLEKTTTELNTTKETLASTITEKDKAVSAAAAATKKAGQLQEELTTTKNTLGTAQAELEAYHGSGMTPEQVVNLGKNLKSTQDSLAGAQEENRLITKKLDRTKRELEKYTIGAERIVYLPANLKGQVLVSDPKWDFVVINLGENQQVEEDGELLVNRNGKLVAKVKVTNVQKDRCIANVMPGWKLGEVFEGDQVIPAHPQS